MNFKKLFTETITEGAHPDITAIKKAAIAKGYKAKYAHFQLTVPMGKMKLKDATKKFMSLSPVKWEEAESPGNRQVYKSGDLTMTFDDFNGKITAQIN